MLRGLSHLFPILPDSEIWFFGYGSCLSAGEINKHRVKEFLKNEDLIEAKLNGYARGFFAADSSGRYLGVTPYQGREVTGLVFPLHAEQVPEFLKSENVPSLYHLEEVSKDIVPLLPYPVFTLVVNKVNYGGKISKSYIKQIKDGLRMRSYPFRENFLEETPLP